MPRTDDLLNVPVWASSGSAVKNLDVRTGEPALTPANGLTDVYSRPDGSKLTYQQFNQLQYWSTRLIDLYQRHGVLEWHASRTYDHPALVYGSDALLYRSVQTSTNQNPTTDSSETYWTAAVPDGRLLPENNGSANTFLAHDKVFRDPATTLGARGRLLPVSNGSAGQVLLHDKTFGAVPSRHQRTELWFGDLTFYNAYNGTTDPVQRRFHSLGSDYDVAEWDWIEIYIRQTTGGSSRSMSAFSSAPLNIPQNDLTVDEGVSTPGQGSATPNGFMNHLLTSTEWMLIWRNDNGRLIGWGRRQNSNLGERHFSVYGTRY